MLTAAAHDKERLLPYQGHSLIVLHNERYAQCSNRSEAIENSITEMIILCIYLFCYLAKFYMLCQKKTKNKKQRNLNIDLGQIVLISTVFCKFHIQLTHSQFSIITVYVMLNINYILHFNQSATHPYMLILGFKLVFTSLVTGGPKPGCKWD